VSRGENGLGVGKKGGQEAGGGGGGGGRGKGGVRGGRGKGEEGGTGLGWRRARWRDTGVPSGPINRSLCV
jgi:hypothetical protein